MRVVPTTDIILVGIEEEADVPLLLEVLAGITSESLWAVKGFPNFFNAINDKPPLKCVSISALSTRSVFNLAHKLGVCGVNDW